MCYLTADPFATKLGLMVHHHKVDCLGKRLDCWVVHKVEVTEKVQNSSDCSYGGHFLNCWTFWNQTWYGDATSWARVSFGKIGLLCSRSRSQQNFKMSVFVQTISYKLLNLSPPNLVWWCIIMSQIVFQKRLVCCLQGQYHSKGSFRM